MVKHITIATIWLGLLIGSQPAQAQDNIHHGKHVIRSMATISPGLLLNEEEQPLYLHGNFDYYLSDRVSFRGVAFYFIDNLGESSKLQNNHQVMGGLAYHFNRQSNFDPYVGFEPGVAFVNTSDCKGENCETSPLGVSPLLSGTLGANYYVGSYFHFFIEGRYVKGQYFPDHEGHFSLDELRLSAGLGWNFNAGEAFGWK